MIPRRHRARLKTFASGVTACRVFYVRPYTVGWRAAILFTISWITISGNFRECAGGDSLKERQFVSGFVKRFCAACHSGDEPAGQLDLSSSLAEGPDFTDEFWETVHRRLRSRQMPPASVDRPSSEDYHRVLSSLELILEEEDRHRPNPGRTAGLRRLNRTEYRNSIRDLLKLDINVNELLPEDPESFGFDNITVSDLSAARLTRYISAAQKISRLALGRPLPGPTGKTYRIPADLTQEWKLAGLPFGTRGGATLHHHFPRSGLYDIQVRLTRDRNEHVEGMKDAHDLFILVDRRVSAKFRINPPRNATEHQTLDADLRTRIRVTAGSRVLGVTFAAKPFGLIETAREPLVARFNMHRHPRLTPAVFEVSVTGPYRDDGPGEVPSRQVVLGPAGNRSESEKDPRRHAARLLAPMIRRAFRRPVTGSDLERPLQLFDQGFDSAGFEGGLELALSSVLVNPQFLFHVERDPEGMESGKPYRIPDFELASRLSFFLWSSLPDEVLLNAAERGDLRQTHLLRTQVRRMLKDPRSLNLVENFAAQWLYLRNLESFTPDLRLFPDFDHNLRQAMRRETELHFQRLLIEDRSVLDLLLTNTTFLNERLARHYGISGVQGSHFRRVHVEPESHRGGLLRQAGFLALTSYPHRTSPVLRGNWILENILGTPTPPPPADVPDLNDTVVSVRLPIRERLAQHRRNPACAECHRLMDPIGFSLENYDAVGRWRDRERGQPIDAGGALPDGDEFEGVAGLEAALLRQPELFVSTFVEKLLTFALGRGIDSYDGPAIRRIVRRCAEKKYRFSSLIMAIIESQPFQMRIAE